jgi:LuxR family maltose regulon positive regulatory protein
VVESRASQGERPPVEREELLATKVAIPRVRTGSLVRPRLLAALDEALARELILVCTPAGFGKTTLLAKTRACGYASGGEALPRRGDSDPSRFWVHRGRPGPGGDPA